CLHCSLSDSSPSNLGNAGPHTRVYETPRNNSRTRVWVYRSVRFYAEALFPPRADHFGQEGGRKRGYICPANYR
ncbi:hypothetical protein AGABI2DRAFT_190837, partial [Agaricus bisporus var. bisporus H97]|uniref:hypothetical protein n=1 Tax=Agaricus bisporus var. bisporus (strain H97 / ATCC MYA-4626 / FGSC 10389) TaxID=936046 RepID=UPI00029F5979